MYLFVWLMDSGGYAVEISLDSSNMSQRRSLFSFGRFGRSDRDEQPTDDTSDGSGTGISATPETPQASSSSRARRPRGPTAAAITIRDSSTKKAHGRIVFQRMPNGALMEPVGLAKACTKAFKRVDNPGGYTWRLTPPAVKDSYYAELQKEFAWSPEDELLVMAMWEQKASKRYSDMMSDYKRKLKASTDKGREMDRPLWMSAEFWTGLQAYWSQEAVQAVSQRARANRMSEPDGPGTGISRHVGGSQSTRILQQSLSLETGLPPAAQNYSTFLRLHMREDGTFLSPRDERLDAEIHRIAVETGREDRLPEIYLEVVRPDRSRLYGTGSAGRSQVSRGSSQSIGTSMMSQQLYETRISPLEERLQAEQAAREAEREASRAEREALEQRMAQFEEFMRRSGLGMAIYPWATDIRENPNLLGWVWIPFDIHG
ncbi:uncharacterized protein LOC130998375 [Salvia miltiorrhiza]|uniref:uncharacterized protein LOC130998375 n=1 Tax=Salvia miltiorrhiza TaxID=226208 RepID=UPI0025AD3E58|nr:uncharacterized protein LOC130998375 [Salvia miltiorrhiza]